MGAKFKKIDVAYKEDAVETQKQIHLIELERSENERLVQLYRTQNEVLDTQNRQYADKVEALEASLKTTDSQLSNLREEFFSLQEANSNL